MNSPTKPERGRYTNMKSHQLMMKDSKRRRKEEGNYKTASKQLIRWHHLLTDNYLNVNGLNLNVNGIEWLTGL